MANYHLVAPKVRLHKLTVRDDGSWLCADGPYLGCVKALCALYPTLRVPDVRNRAIPFHERTARVAIVTIKSDHSTPCVTEYNVPGTTTALKDRLWANPSRIQCHPDCKVESVIYLVEGLNLEIVSIFGYKLDIDPMVFASHERTSNAHTLPNEPGVGPRLLSLINRDAKWNITYYDIRVPPPGDIFRSYTVGCALSGRDAQTQSFDGKWEQPFILTRKCSIWRQAGCKDAFPSSWYTLPQIQAGSLLVIALILCDPPFSKAHIWSKAAAQGQWEIEVKSISTMPHQGGYADVLPRPSSFISWQGLGPERQGLYRDLLYYLTQRTQEMLCDKDSSIDIERVTIKIITSHYLSLLDYFDGIIYAREFPLSRKKNFSTQETLNMEEQWSTIQLIRSRLSRCIHNVSLTMVQLRIPFEDPGTTDTSPNSPSSEYPHEFQYIYMQLRVLKTRADLLNESLTGLTGILGNKRSIREAKTVKTLTLVALIFIPLSFTSALFSMYDDFLPGRESFWIFWVVFLPLVIAVLVLATILDFGYDDNGTWRPTAYLSIWNDK